MSTTEITPELLRAVADWTFETAIDSSVAHTLRDAAAQLERERADEKLIEMYARILLDTVHPDAAPWPRQTESIQDRFRAGVRVLFANAETIPQPRFDQCSDCGETFPFPVHLHHDEQECTAARGASETCTKPETAQLTPCAHEPRTWQNLRDVPDDVRLVTDREGDKIVRAKNTRCGWRWTHFGGTGLTQSDLTAYAPYAEVIADD